MKILIISNISTTGGTRTYLSNLLRYYKKIKCEIVIASETVDDVKNLLSYEKITNVTLVNLKSRPLWLRAINDYIHLPIIIYEYVVLHSLLRSTKPDLVVVTPASVGIFITAIAFSIRKILVIHSYPMARISFFYNLLFKYTQNTYILTVSKFSKNNIKKYWNYGKFRLNITYIYNPSEIKIKPATNRNIILTVGHIESYKDPHTWIMTAKQFIKTTVNLQYKFVWVGVGSLEAILKSEIKLNGLESICFVFPASNKIAQYYSSACLYFQPSLVESQGISVANAQYSGIPCVVSNIGGLPEMVKNNETGYVCDPRDWIDMSEKIKYLINNHETYHNFSINAIRKHEKNTLNTWSKHMNVYHKKFRLL